MRCSSCESEVADTDKFCHECGRPIHTKLAENRREALRQSAADVAAEGKIIAREVLEVTKKGIKTETGRSVAAYAAIGAVAGSAIPFVGSITGAGVGALIGAVRKI